MNLTPLPLCAFALLHSPWHGVCQDYPLCTRSPPPASSADMSPTPAQAVLDGPQHHQPCWDAGLSSHGSALPQGSKMSLLHFWCPCASSVSPSAALLLPHTTMQWDIRLSNTFPVHILCFTTAPAPSARHKPGSILHIPSSPHSPSYGLEKAQPVPAVC